LIKYKKFALEDSEVIKLISNKDIHIFITVGTYKGFWISTSSCGITNPRRGYMFPMVKESLKYMSCGDSREGVLYSELSRVHSWLKKTIKEFPRYKKYDNLIPIWNKPKYRQQELF
jgi:hypothetical protein